MPDSLPLFPLGAVLFPGMVLPLHIFERRYRRMFGERADSDPIFGIVLTRSGREVGDQPEIHDVGTAATLLKAVSSADGRIDLAVRGGKRFRVIDGHWDLGYLTATVAWLPDARSDASPMEAMRLADQVREAFGAYLDALERTAGLRIERTGIGGEPVAVAYTVSSVMPFGMAQRQRLLQAEPPLQLLEILLSMLRHERNLLLATGIGGAAIGRPELRFSAN